jgi:hypothetical protein
VRPNVRSTDHHIVTPATAAVTQQAIKTFTAKAQDAASVTLRVEDRRGDGGGRGSDDAPWLSDSDRRTDPHGAWRRCDRGVGQQVMGTTHKAVWGRQSRNWGDDDTYHTTLRVK